MQTKLVATSIVAAILCSCLLVYDGEGPVATLGSNQLSQYSESTSLGEFKIHKPGESHDSDETLVWYPNNVTELSTMQFTIFLDSSLQTESITQISIIGSIEITEQQEFEQFSTTVTDFEIEEIEGRVAIIENYSYPSTIWGGNYSVTIDITFSSNNNLILERDDVQFGAYGVYFGYPTINQKSTLCSCEEKQIELVLVNTGEDETTISYSLDVDETYQNARIELTEESEEYSTGSVIAGDTLTFTFNILLSKSPVTKDGIVKIPVYLRAYYETDDGEIIYLSNQEIDIDAIVLEESVFPGVELSFGDFDYQFEYIDGNQPKLPDDVNSDLFTLDANFFQFQMILSNNGYYDRELRVSPTNSAFNYRIINGDDNLTLNEFNFRKPIISSLESQNLTVMIRNIGSYEAEQIGFDIMFNESLNSTIYFDIKNEPELTNAVLTHNLLNQEITELPTTITEFVEINLAEYEDHLFFDNEWNLLCTTAGLVAVEIPIFASPCLGDPIQINYANDSSKLSSIEIEVNVDESYLGESVIIELDLQPMILPITTAPLHTLIVEIPINIQDNDNDGNTQTGNNNSNNTDDSNNTDNSNNTTDDDDNNAGNNQTNFDIDNDGIPNLVDDCPDTKPGDTVDEFGCTIIDTGTDDEQQNNAEQQQNNDNPASKSDETNVLLYAVIGLIIVAIIGGVLVIRNRSSAKPNNSAISTVANPVMPLPVMPLAPLEPVVLQQWTDANGYSWRQMSDQTIMWWNGTDWIPYGKN